MIIGSTIIHDGTGTTKYYSPPFSRLSQAATFAIEVTHEGGSPTLVVAVDSKNADDPSWTEHGTFTAITAVGKSTKDLGSLNEQIRFSFRFSAGSLGDFMHVVVAEPAWRWYD